MGAQPSAEQRAADARRIASELRRQQIASTRVRNIPSPYNSFNRDILRVPGSIPLYGFATPLPGSLFPGDPSGMSGSVSIYEIRRGNRQYEYSLLRNFSGKMLYMCQIVRNTRLKVGDTIHVNCARTYASPQIAGFTTGYRVSSLR